ncbi:MAG: ChaN family lipoprotein [Hyphomicrobiaceae bacterium]|nr:ChaN family lipoprotein [Hyphomicrobiaceae bacterium]
MGILARLVAVGLAIVASAWTDATRAGVPHPLCAGPGASAGGAGSTARDLCAVVLAHGPGGAPQSLEGLAEHGAGRLPEPLAAADVLLLGEVHDNPIHHRLRAGMIHWLEDARLKAGKPAPALVAEHIRADQALGLAGFHALGRSRRGVETARFFEALEWDKSGWPGASMFEPLFGAALDHGWPIIPGNVSRANIRNVARNGQSVLRSDEVVRLGLDAALPEPLQTSLLDELEASHCGLLPKSAFMGLADAQRYRDAHMARALIDAAARQGRAVLVAGNGHVRSDRGVPWHLRRMEPRKSIAMALFLEVEADKVAAADYVTRDAQGRPLADVFYLTARIERPDPCVEMRKRFGK